MYHVVFTLFGNQRQETIDALMKDYLVVVDKFEGKDGKEIVCYRCCREEEA